MKSSFVGLTLLLLLSLSVVRVDAVSFWINGKVVDVAGEKEYNGLYVEFTLEVTNASAVGPPFPSNTFPFNISCVAPLSLGNVSDFPLDASFNLTGEVTTTPPVPQGVPGGYFLISAINKENVTVGWIETLKTIIISIASIGRLTVTLIVQIIFAFAGIEVPTYIISLVLVGMIIMFFLKWGKKLPWILLLIVFLMAIALVADLLMGIHL